MINLSKSFWRLYAEITGCEPPENSDQPMSSAVLEQLPVAVGIMNAKKRWAFSNRLIRRLMLQGPPSADPARIALWQGFDGEGHPLPPTMWPESSAVRGARVIPGMTFLYGDSIWIRIAAAPLIVTRAAVDFSIVVAEQIKGQALALRDTSKMVKELDQPQDKRAEWQLAHMDAVVVRQNQLIAKLRENGQPAIDAEAHLVLFLQTRELFQESLAVLRHFHGSLSRGHGSAESMETNARLPADKAQVGLFIPRNDNRRRRKKVRSGHYPRIAPKS